MAEPEAFGRELLRTAVATPSPSGREQAVVGRLLAALRGRVDEAARDGAGNLVARCGDGPLSVLFLGHVDTVPGEVPGGERDGRLYGRGAVDAKGPLCAALAATAALRGEASRRLTVRVVGAVGEEAPGSVGARHVARVLPAPDLLVICEPSGWDAVTLGYKGHLRARLSCERPGGHSAGPEATAADRLVDALAVLRRAVERAQDASAGGRAFEALQLAVLDLRHEHDGLRERSAATVGVRLPPAWPPERFEALLAATPLGEGIERRTIESVPAVRGPRDSALARAFRVAIRGEGGRPRAVVKTGTSDWNVVAGAWPVPTIAYGPGDAALDHAPDEHIAWSDFDAAVRVLANVLARLAGDAARAG